MSNKNIEQFVATYGPVALQVSKEINVDPNILLSQWGLESRWGQTEMAKKYNNLGGIKDFSGKGLEAKDNKTGSLDKYVKFEDPEVFGMYYVDQIKRNFPLAMNTGPDVGAFTRGLASGKRGSYFGIPAQEYETSLARTQASLPEDRLLPFEPTALEPTEGKPAPASGSQETDEQREARMQADIDAQEKRQAQLIGAGTGAGIAATRAAGSGAGAVIQAGANRAGQGFRAGMQGSAPTPPPAPPAAAPNAPAGPRPPLGSTIMRQPVPSGGPDAGRMAPGQTGTMPYNYGKAAGLTDIEAGRALDMTKQTGGVHDLATQRREGMNKVQSLFPGEKYVENPRFGGLLTPDQGVGGGPRESFSMKPPVAPTPDLPQGQPGGLSQLPPRQPIPTAPVPPKPPSGLDTVTNMFKGMMRPVASAVSAASKYVLPPLALASAAGEGVNIAQQARKPEGQRDMTGMALSGANILGSGMSLFPATAPVGVPLAIGSAAAQAYRDSPDAQAFIRKKMQGLADTPLLDEMTGPLP
jgi:hypothetical protein